MGSTAITISNSYFSHHDEVMLLGHNDNHLADSGMQVRVESGLSRGFHMFVVFVVLIVVSRGDLGDYSVQSLRGEAGAEDAEVQEGIHSCGEQ